MQKNLRKALMLSVAVAGPLLATGEAGAAEVRASGANENAESAAAMQPADAAPPSSAVRGGLEEIVVSAQRRDEKIQDVPIALAAVTGDNLIDAGVKDIGGLGQLVPGLQMVDRNGSAAPTLRGVGAIGNSVGGADGSTVVYLDGVSQSTFIAPLFSLNNVQRVEVLKGPQGTLFGRNATAGVLQIITKTPQFTPTADMTIGYGNYETIEGSFYGTTGLSEKVAIDLAFYYRNQADGWGINVTNGFEVGRMNQLSIRSKLLFQPDELTDITAAFGYNEMESSRNRAGALPGSIQRDGSTSPGFYNTALNLREWPTRIDQTSASLTVSREIGWARILSISAWQKYNLDLDYDLDFTPTPIRSATVFQPQTVFTQELQLQSAPGSRISWVVGGFYLHDVTKISPQRSGGVDTLTNLTTNSYSAFGQVTAPVFTNTNVTLGVRYTRDEKHLLEDVEAVGGGLPPPFVIGFVCPRNPTCHYDVRENFGELTYRAAIDHKITEDFMVYASYNRGYKSGNIKYDDPLAPRLEPETIDAFEVGFKSEWLDRRLRFNASAFRYYYRNMHVSILNNGLPGQDNAPKSRVEGVEVDFMVKPDENLTLFGAGSYLNARFTSFPNGLSYYPRTPTTPCVPAVPLTTVPIGSNCGGYVTDVSGKQMPYSPKWGASLGFQYDIPTSMGRWSLSANLRYTDKQPGSNQDASLFIPAYTVVNAALRYTDPSELWTVRLWSNNITDKKYLVLLNRSSGDTGSPGAPRTYGIEISRHF